MMIEVEQATGAKFTHVPYKGGAEWMQALMGGEVHFICDAAQWAPFVDDGQCRILALATEQRIAKYKDVPTLSRARHQCRRPEPLRPGRPQGHAAGTSSNRSISPSRQAMGEPKVNEYLEKFIQLPWYKNPAEYRAFAEKYYVEVKPLLIKAGLAKG